MINGMEQLVEQACAMDAGRKDQRRGAPCKEMTRTDEDTALPSADRLPNRQSHKAHHGIL